MRRVTEELKDRQRSIVDNEIKKIETQIEELEKELASLDINDYDEDTEFFEERNEILEEISLLKFDKEQWEDEYETIEQGYSELCLSPEELFLGE